MLEYGFNDLPQLHHYNQARMAKDTCIDQLKFESVGGR